MEKPEDKALRQSVIDELDFDPSVDATTIGVFAADGVVTLAGYVSSFAEKTAAEQAVRRVKGVRAVAQELEVRYPSSEKTADDQIARRVLDIFRWSAIVPHDRINVTVSDGWVTLVGQVDWQFERGAAEDEVRNLSGVAGVINNITVKPRVDPGDVQRQIEDALKRSAAVEAAGVRVHVVGSGKIRLEGRVRTWQEHDIVARAAWSAPGVHSVEDRLTIA